MQSIRLTFVSIIALSLGVSCTSQKAVISQNQAETSTIEVAKVQASSNSLMIQAANEKVSPTLYASTSEVIQVDEISNETVVETKKEKINAMLDKVIARKNENKVTTARKANFIEKIIIKKIEKKMKKQSALSSDFSSWDPFLKIGLILLGIGIILAIIGLGTVGGLAAFIGILFTIVGLLHEI